MEESKKKAVEIPVDGVFPSFQEHLSRNGRILFSGKFGMGKTYFLNKFFQANKDEYEYFHLYPVNYQINRNEDILSLLKHDLLIELLKKDKDIFLKNDIQGLADWSHLAYLFYKSNKRDIISAGLNVATSVISSPLLLFGFDFMKLGRPLKDVLPLVEKFSDSKKKIEKGEKGEVEDFLKKFKSIDDTDYIISLIREKIQNKTKKNNKKSVLIIDDLDRIDPDHIFRLLNVFSAHFGEDNKELPNRFGFDKVVFVCDYKNIQSIFYHKFGKDADFSAYIDKFFEAEVYHFTNKKAVSEAVGGILQQFNAADDLSTSLERKGFLRYPLEQVFLSAIELKHLSMRQLLKPLHYQISVLGEGMGYRSGARHDIVPQYMLLAVEVLRVVFSDKQNLQKVLADIKNNANSSGKVDRVYSVCAYYLLRSLSVDQENISKLLFKGYTINVQGDNISSIKIESTGESVHVSEFFYELLILAADRESE